MNEQQLINYQRIARAIDYLKLHFQKQPSLEALAEKLHMSPFHFQRLFTDWAGTSPKKFLQYISIEHAKSMLKQQQATLFETAMQTGLSGTGRLHDLFVSIEGMTPAEYKKGGKNLKINYHLACSPFGKILLASTPKGICYMAFTEEEQQGILTFKEHFPNAEFSQQSDSFQENALSIFNRDWSELQQIKLHLKGTEFQLKVWEALLKIPEGRLSSYSLMAREIGKPNASRAVGSAIGRNPVAFLIPCHRVIQSSGLVGGYMWGNTRKTAIIAWEAAKRRTQF